MSDKDVYIRVEDDEDVFHPSIPSSQRERVRAERGRLGDPAIASAYSTPLLLHDENMTILCKTTVPASHACRMCCPNFSKGYEILNYLEERWYYSCYVVGSTHTGMGRHGQ